MNTNTFKANTYMFAHANDFSAGGMGSARFSFQVIAYHTHNKKPIYYNPLAH